jgi:subtilisin family serine protease
MEYSVLCNGLPECDHVYDTLVCKTSGTGVLFGAKRCIDEHIMTPDVMTFELTHEEAIAASKLPGVIRVEPKITIPVLSVITTKTQTGTIKAAAYNIPNNDLLPHSLYYHTNFELNYTHNDPVTSGSSTTTLSGIDCSNVDIVVMDSGIDKTHPDFNDDSGNSRVVLFDWTKLRDGNPTTGTQILATQSVNYYNDTDGHGTSCASLAAGKRCGFAKNAKIYSLRSNELGGTTDGIASITSCLKLALAFVKAKKLNLHGLSSTRPTIFSNSWNSNLPAFLMINDATTRFNNIVSQGPGATNNLVGRDDTVDSYVRQIVSDGGHFTAAAGNQNQYLQNTSTRPYCILYFDSSGRKYITVNDSSTSALAINTVINVTSIGNCTLQGKYDVLYSTSSPNVGLGYLKTNHPAIIVGDITPVGNTDYDGIMYWTGGNMRSAYKTLKESSSPQLKKRMEPPNNTLRYTSSEGPFFIKTSYSNFGPDVDIYATGNATWAALSNQSARKADPDSGEPVFTRGGSEYYHFFNGTSAATPIITGIIATYLSQFPSATPIQARDWLLTSAVKGNIASTTKTTLNVTNISKGGTTQTINLALGPEKYEVLTDGVIKRTCRADNINFNTANIEDFAFCHRFFDSNNLIAQAYPLRKGVFNTVTSTLARFDTNLTKKSITTEPLTHDL